MRKVREVLRLKHVLGMSYRKIGEATGVGKTQAAEYVRRGAAAGMTWPVPPGIADVELDRRLFPVVDDGRARPAIDWPAIAEAARCDAAAAVAGVSGRSAGWLQLHAVLRAA
jgi:hypothetical protein